MRDRDLKAEVRKCPGFNRPEDIHLGAGVQSYLIRRCNLGIGVEFLPCVFYYSNAAVLNGSENPEVYGFGTQIGWYERELVPNHFLKDLVCMRVAFRMKELNRQYKISLSDCGNTLFSVEC